MFGVTVVTEPAEEPVNLPEALEQLRFPHAHENLYIQALIVAARKHVEKVTGQALITQTLRLTRDGFPGWKEGYTLRLPRPPLISLTADIDNPDLGIVYTDADGDEQEVDPLTYVVDASSIPGRVALKYGETWPTDVTTDIASVRATYTSGYGPAAAVPETFKLA